MSDWIGLLFFVLLVVGTFIGLKLLSRKRNFTKDEYEESLARSGSMLSSGVAALNGILSPSAEKGDRAVQELKHRTPGGDRRPGKGIGTSDGE